MKKSASILDYSYPFLDPAVWDHEQKLYSYHKDFILRLLNSMYENYKLKQPEAWITDIRIIGSLTTSKWLFTSDMDVHMVVNLAKFIEINMPGTDPKVAYEYLDATRKEFDRAKILAPMTQHPIEYYFEVPEFITTNTSMVGVYSISQDAWLKAPIIFEADLDFEESKKQVMTQAEAIAETLDGSFGKIDRQIDRIKELEIVIGAWDRDKQQLFYNKIEEKVKAIEAEILTDLELRQALIDARHAAQDPMADIEIKFKWLQRFGFFGILTNLKNLMTETGGQITLQELPLIKKIVTDSSLKEAFLKQAFEKETETDICVDLDKTIAKPAKFPAIGEPIEGAKEALKKLQQLGYKVIIYSCRTGEKDGLDAIKEYLDKHDLPYDSIFEGEKPFAKFYIDDHAIKFDNWDNVLKQVEKSEKKASLHVTAKLNQKYWIDPSGKEIEVDRYLGHYGWIYENVFKKPYDGHSVVPQDAMAQVEEKAQEMISQGWTRVTTESDYDFAMEVADLNNLPSYLDNFVASHYSGGGIEIDDLSGEYQDLQDPFPSLKKAIYEARRLRNAASKAFSKRDIKAHSYDVLGDPSLRQGPARAVFNFVQKGVPEMDLPDLDMFDILGDHPRYGSTVNRNTLKELNVPITEDKVAKQAQTKKIKQGDYSCVMALIPHDLAQEIVAWGVRNVPDEDVYLDGDKFGRELESHVTIKYGLFTDDGKKVRRSFNDSKPFKAKLGKVRHFEPPELPFDVLTVEVISEDLQKANAMICDKFECEEGLVSDEYKPHITIAYMKRGDAKEYVGADDFEGREVVLDTIIFSPNKGNRTYFSVGTDKESSFVLEKLNKFASEPGGYWIDPAGTVYDAHGEGLIHYEWVLANLEILRDNYGINISPDLFTARDEYFDLLQHDDGDNIDMPGDDDIINQMLQKGWVRVGDADEGTGVELNDLRAIPPSVDATLTQDLLDGDIVRVEDINHNSVIVEYPYKSLQQAVNRALSGQPKKAEFLPSLFNAPDNKWQMAEGGDDKEIALNPDSVSDDPTEYEPCTTGKPRSKEVWRQFISMFSNLFSKNDTTKIESALDTQLVNLGNITFRGKKTHVVKVEVPQDLLDQYFAIAIDMRKVVNDPKVKTNGPYWDKLDHTRAALHDQLVEFAFNNLFEGKNWEDFPSVSGEIRSKISEFVEAMVPRDDLPKEAAYDPALEEIEKNELGEDQTAHEYSKDFKDLNLINKPHNTTWDSLVQDGEPSKPTSVTYSPEMNEDNLDQNSPGGYPRRFMGKPKGQWFSNEGEVNNTLIQMLRNRTAVIESTTTDITKEAFLQHAYWIDPNGKIFEVRGAEDSDETHWGWISDHEQMLRKDYGVKGNEINTDTLVSYGWVRIGDGSNAQNWQVQVKSIKNIPPVVDNVLAQFVPAGAQIEFTDSSNDYAVAKYPFKNSQHAVNRALRMSMAASLKEAGITKRYAIYVNGIAYPAARTLTRNKAIRIVKERFPEAYAKGRYEIREEEFTTASLKEAGSQSASVPDYLIDEWKTEQIMNNTDEEPYVNHDQRDYPYGMHDSPENTGSGIGWPKDNQPSVVHLDTLENPAFRNDPFGIGEYHITYYNAMPMSDGMEATNPE